jgi:asparagine synthase (glutamine-hydrolysing)
MCGITVCIALNRQCSHPGAGKVNGDLDTNANRAHTDGHTNSHTNRAYTNGQPKPDPNLHQKLHNSLDKIAHRGPDARGVWISDDGLVGLSTPHLPLAANSNTPPGLGHNRLAINDLSPDGDQPIHSDDDTIHAVVNGEIYDYDRLRAELTSLHGYQFRGHSDSELVVALYKSYGAPRFLDYLRGEFALVVHDERTGSIVAARDRFGIKPLFWTVIGEGDDKRLLLAAEAKAFLALDWEAEWDVGSLVESGWASNDNRTLFKGVRKVMPGYWMGVTADGVIEHHRYFDIDYKDKVRFGSATKT